MNAPPGMLPGRMAGHRTIVRLIWLYFWLLIFEGALRKWILPGLSGPLLIVRDPVAILIIFQAMREGIKIPRGIMVAMLGLALLFGLLGMIQIMAGRIPPTVFLFGMRTYFLHLPLVFIIGVVVQLDDVRRLVRWTLLISIPMTVLMAYQFVSPADAWINKGVGQEGSQIIAAREHIRAAGTFSFVSGTVAFCSLMLACCLAEFFTIRKAGWNMNHVVLACCVLLSMTSGSRGLVVSLGIVVITFVVCVLSRPGSLKGGSQAIAVGVLSLFALSSTSLFQEGVATMTERTMGAAEVEGGGAGFLQRITNEFTSPLGAGLAVPIYGGGIGLGTNAGAMLASGSVGFLMAEAEWGRVMGEAGLVGGVLLIGFRSWIVIWLGLRGFRSAKQGNTLPMLLFGAGAAPMWNGQWGQATSLGFAVFVCGLAWAAGESRAPAMFPVLRPFAPAMRRTQLVRP